MVIFDYTHTFTIQQLDVILTQYLQLGPYYQCLKKVLSNYITKFQSYPLIQRHNPDKQHPIRLPIKCSHYKNKQSGQIDKDDYQGQIQFVYPLTTIIEVLNSNQFYQQLPKNIIINGLLTTTNINIIIQTLTILSQQLSKLIKSTLNSIEEKQLTNYINTLVNDCLQGKQLSSQKLIQSKKRLSSQLGFLGLLFEKGFKMINQQNKQQKSQTNLDVIPKNNNINSIIQITGIDTQPILQSIHKINDKGKTNIRRNAQKRSSIIASLLSASDLNKQDTKNLIKSLKTLIIQDKMTRPLQQIKQVQQKNTLDEQLSKKPRQFKQCEYCRNIRNYILQSTGQPYFDINQISKIPTDAYIKLKRIKNVVNVFTLYLRQTNQTVIPNNINVINKVLSNINIVITENLWENDKLNPKMKDKLSNNKKTNSSYISSYNNNMTSSSSYNKSYNKPNSLISQLQPYFKQIYNYQTHDSNQYTIDELLRISLKAPQIKQIQKQLTQKYMNQARVKKQGKNIQTIYITKQKLNNQLIIPSEQIDDKSIKYCNNYFSNNKNQNNKFICNNSNQPFVNQIQLLRQYEKQQTIINRAVINSKPIYSQINHNYQQQINLNNQIKKHKTMILPKSIKNIDKSQSTKQMKKNNDVIQNQKFKIIMYQQYMKREGFNVTKNNMSNIINNNVLKLSKKANSRLNRQNSTQGRQNQNYLNYNAQDQIDGFTQFISNSPPSNANTMSSVHLKTQQQNDTSYDKKQTEIYNKMLLNGQTIRTEILNQVQYGQAIIYDSLDDFMNKLNQIAAQQEQSQTSQQTNDNDTNQNLFLTLCGANLKKTMSNKRSTPKRQQSIRNSKKIFDIQNIKNSQHPNKNGQNMNKTQSNKLNKKYSLISLQNNTKQLLRTTKNTNSNNINKKHLDQPNNEWKQSGIKKQIKFKKYNQNNISLNDSLTKQYNQNLQIKKPVWLDQYVDNTSTNQQYNSNKVNNWTKQNKAISNNKNGKTLLQNQRFLAYKQKNYLQQCLNVDRQKQKNSKLQRSRQINNRIQSSSQINMNKQLNPKILKQSLNNSRPLSGTTKTNNRSKMGTVNSIGRTLSGKKRSIILGKQYVVENNSLLSRIYKQNMDDNLYKNTKKQVDKQQQEYKFNLKISKCKF